jgi:hypothetical protein
LEDKDLRLKMSNTGRNCVKGSGPIKIVEYCIKTLFESKSMNMGVEYGI